MPWKEVNLMSLRREFVTLAAKGSVSMNRLCERFGISTKTGYKWLSRYSTGGNDGLRDQSRRPHHSPLRTPSKVERVIIELRQKHPAWGPRKLRRRLIHLHGNVWPSVSTFAAILHRYGCIDSAESIKHHVYTRFEAPEPNALWQMDFKGHFPIGSQRCYPLTVLDDHSRFNLGLCYACTDQSCTTVQAHLRTIFRRYGLPLVVITDNGTPWGTLDCESYTSLAVWLMRLGIQVSHSRPHHPQTLGKEERFHRSLKAEVLKGRMLTSFPECQLHFDQWRIVYNLERPHEALHDQVPASRYQPSPKVYPEELPPIEYDDGYSIRKVQAKGEIYFHNQEFKIGKAFHRFPVALKPTTTDGLFEVYFCHFKVSEINLNQKSL